MEITVSINFGIFSLFYQCFSSVWTMNMQYSKSMFLQKNYYYTNEINCQTSENFEETTQQPTVWDIQFILIWPKRMPLHFVFTFFHEYRITEICYTWWKKANSTCWPVNMKRYFHIFHIRNQSFTRSQYQFCTLSPFFVHFISIPPN